MSTQQQPTTPKPPRGPRRQPKRVATTPVSFPTTQSQHSPFANRHSTPPRGTPPSPSRDGNPTYDSSNTLSEGAVKKKNYKGKKRNNFATSSPAANANKHRQTASQPMVNSPPRAQDSPRYAGPTFHASPAPSALPIPTFFSKSVPASGFPHSRETEDESQDEPGQSTPSKPKSVPLEQSEVGEPSPLDFLFKAARDARNAAGSIPNGNGQSRQGSPVPQRQPSQPDGVPGSVFPFELENNESKSIQIGPSFATPYKERMNALRSSSSPSPSNDRCLDEEQLKAKSDALKGLLFNGHSHGSPFKSPSSSPGAGMYSPMRHTSGPPTPMSGPFNDHKTPTKPSYGASGKDSIPHQYLASLCHSAKSQRTASSSLRKELSPASPVSPPRSPLDRNRNAHAVAPRSDFVAPTPPHPASSHVSGPSPARAVPPKTDPADMRRMEDDLRKFLNIA